MDGVCYAPLLQDFAFIHLPNHRGDHRHSGDAQSTQQLDGNALEIQRLYTTAGEFTRHARDRQIEYGYPAGETRVRKISGLQDTGTHRIRGDDDDVSFPGRVLRDESPAR